MRVSVLLLGSGSRGPVQGKGGVGTGAAGLPQATLVYPRGLPPDGP